ncbi:MAG: hypothetical protein MRZ75_06240 [Roseburia sp.]|uniref:transmembrane-type terpene cyclase n=1 Tax=Roseburia sp. 831b TaxID=1261635 RepID=UPI0009532F24|nr:hypothetical protein [Roseburia sp. 831b]MCI5918904.1 hypothetical protein [Roseburia sp.]WVK73335.1 hypothetical protein BIV16_02120 [Roseburia sp. 831b]
MILFLTLLSGIAWTIVYEESIRVGFKDKTYCMPLFALALNICWEGLYSGLGILEPNGAQTVVNIIWFLCDILITVTYFKYAKPDFPDHAKKYFIPFSVLAFISCFLIQYGFYVEFGRHMGSRYSAFLQNVAMSILFLIMLFRRDSSKGQNMTIAIAKWIGTLAPAIQMGILEGFDPFIVICGVLCSVFDLIYIFMLPNVASLRKKTKP